MQGDDGKQYYAVLQRWEFFGEWPHKVNFAMDWEDDFVLSRSKKMAVRRQIVLCNGAINIPSSEDKGYELYYTKASNSDSMYLGEAIVCSDAVDMGLIKEAPSKPNDIHIGVVVSAPSELTAEELDNKFAPIISRLAFFVQAYFSGLAARRSSITVFHFESNGISQTRTASPHFSPRGVFRGRVGVPGGGRGELGMGVVGRAGRGRRGLASPSGGVALG